MVVKAEKSMGDFGCERRALMSKERRGTPRVYAGFISVPIYFSSRGASSLKLTADSAGRTTSLFPVNADPAPPAPAPAKAPIAAPLPPPARPPMSAPTPAPPPVRTAVLLPLPFAERVIAEVSMECSTPFTLIEFNLICTTAPPLNLPRALASVTVPRASAPAGITVSPPTATGAARVAVNDWPGLLIFDPNASPRRTVSVVPAGTTFTGLAAEGRLELPELPVSPPDGAF